MKNLFIFIALLFSIMQVQAQPVPTDYFADTVWTNKTDQSAGFYMVKFSNTDSIIVGHGYDYDLFFDAKTGQEIRRILGNHEIFFINNDKNFIRSNESRTKFEIFDGLSYQVIDSLENDNRISTGSVDISKDEKYLVSTIDNGIRVWDLQTKKILKTKLILTEPNLISASYDVILFACDQNKLIGHLIKTYQDPNYPGDPKYFKTIGSYYLYDFNTLDSIGNFFNARGFRKSNTCRYIAIATGDPDYGVEVYDFNTKQLLWKIPINGPSLTGIEFSPDDKYLVTSSGPDVNAIFIWDLETGKKYYEYKDGGYGNIDVSNNGKYIITSILPYLLLYPAKFGPSEVHKDSGIVQPNIYPNPSDGIAVIQFHQPVLEKINVILSNLSGNQIKILFNNYLEAGNHKIDINTNDISSGSYFIKVQSLHLSLVFKLILNK